MLKRIPGGGDKQPAPPPPRKQASKSVLRTEGSQLVGLEAFDGATKFVFSVKHGGPGGFSKMFRDKTWITLESKSSLNLPQTVLDDITTLFKATAVQAKKSSIYVDLPTQEEAENLSAGKTLTLFIKTG